jgi:hypothetical protein
MGVPMIPVRDHMRNASVAGNSFHFSTGMCATGGPELLQNGATTGWAMTSGILWDGNESQQNL